MQGGWTSLSVVVSGGSSAAIGLGCRPSSPAVRAKVSPPKKRRSLSVLRFSSIAQTVKARSAHLGLLGP
jgi:hypothetical protein